MKSISIVFVVAGLVLCLVAMSILFFQWTTNDWTFMKFLWAGFFLYCIGEYLNAKNWVIYSPEYRRKRRMMMRDMILAAIGSLILFIASFIAQNTI